MSPIYRPEQSRLSFHGEAGHGGYMDYISTVADPADWTGALNGVAAAGSRSVTFNGASGTIAVGNYVLVGTGANAELRKVAFLGDYNGTAATGTIYLDYPLGFYHASGETIDEKTIDATLVGSSFATFLPGVYESVTVPDLTPEQLPQYYLSTGSNRNWSYVYKGRQSFAGSLSNFILLNGYPLRFPIGTVRTTASATQGTVITVNGAHYKGQRTLATAGAGSAAIANGEYLYIEDGGTNPEVRQVISGGGTGSQVLNYPLMFDHANSVSVERVNTGGSYYFTHTVVETNELDSMTWNLLMRDTDATPTATDTGDFIRRYVGGMVNRATLSAEEGELLRFSWDDVQFLDLVHNQTFHSSVGAGATEITKSSSALIDPTRTVLALGQGIGGSMPHTAAALGVATYPTNAPYYFSQGSLTFFDIEFARIRNFRLEINNNIEPRYYFTNQGTNRIPSEMQEQRREYRMAATIALPDSIALTASTRSLWKELILEGDYGSGVSGFDAVLTFTRGANDKIEITIPANAASTAFEDQGIIITRAPHNIATEAPVQVDLEMMFRSMSVVVTDDIAVYP